MEVVIILNNACTTWIPPIPGIYRVKIESYTLKPTPNIIHICCNKCSKLTYHNGKFIPALYSILPNNNSQYKMEEFNDIDIGVDGAQFYFNHNDTVAENNLPIVRIVLSHINN